MRRMVMVGSGGGRGKGHAVGVCISNYWYSISIDTKLNYFKLFLLLFVAKNA